MQQRFSKTDLQEQAAEIFGKLGTNVLFATSDGQFFEMENRAEGHAAGKMGVYRLEAESDGVVTTEGTEDGAGRKRLTYADLKAGLSAAGLLQATSEEEANLPGSEQTSETTGSAQSENGAETGNPDETPAAPEGGQASDQDPAKAQIEEPGKSKAPEAGPAPDQDPAKTKPDGPGMRRQAPPKKTAPKKAATKKAS